MKRRALLALLFLLPLLAFVPALAPAQVASQSYFENFNTDTTGSPPSDEWYTVTSSSGAYVINAGLESKGMRADVSASGSFLVTTTTGADWDICTTGGALGWAFKFTSMPAATELLRIFQVGDAAPSGFWLQVSDAGATRLFGGNGGMSAAGPTIVVDTWYNATFTNIDCGNGQATVFFEDQDAAISVDEAAWTPPLDDFRIQGDSAGNSGIVVIDNVSLFTNSPPPSAVGAFATVSDWDANSLVGFDVDGEGTTLIARVNDPGCGGCTIGGFQINTYAGNTLTAQGTFDSDCDRQDGVMSIGSHVMFVECGSAHGCADQDPCTFDVRNPNLSPPNFGTCGDECPAHLDMSLDGSSVSDGGGDDVREIAEVRQFPISFTNRESFFGVDEANLAMAYTGNNGELGVQAYQGRNNAVDHWQFTEVNFAGTVPDQLCTGMDSSDQYYIGAADAGRAPAIYNVDFTRLTTGGNAFGYQPVMSLRQSGSSALSGGKGLDCAGDEYLTVVELGAGDVDKVYKVDLPNGTATLLDTVDGAARGVAMSESNTFRYYAWVDGSTIKINNGTVGESTCAITMPSGAFYEMQFDTAAQSLWVATDDVIALYKLQQAGCTTDEPQSNTGGIGGNDPPGGPGAGATSGLSGAGAAFAPFGVSTFGGNLIWAAAIIMGMAISGGTGIATMAMSLGARNRDAMWEFAKWGLMAGAILGFFVVWGFKLVNTATVAGIVILAALGVGLKYYSSRVKGG